MYRRPVHHADQFPGRASSGWDGGCDSDDDFLAAFVPRGVSGGGVEESFDDWGVVVRSSWGGEDVVG